VRLWFDEDLSPTLVQVAQERGFEATCNRDRAVLGINDPQLRQTAQREDFVLVTDNASDFRPMYARDEVHPGLIVMPAGHGRAHQRELAPGYRLDHEHRIRKRSDPRGVHGQPTVEIDADGVVAVYDLP
jgi:predicted nuclease of predicted toxin-antitoxin system